MSRGGARGTLRRRGTVVEAGRAALGVWHLLDARREATRADGGRPDRRVAAFYRILSVRQTAQAALIARSGTPEAHTLGAAVDTVHAISMLPLLLVDRRLRRFALSQLLIASTLAVLEVSLVGTRHRR